MPRLRFHAGLLLHALVMMEFATAGVVVNPVSDDLWDLSQGTTITSHSAEHRSFPIEAIFSETPQPHALFSDAFVEDHVQFVEWQTTSTIDLRSFSLLAIHDGTPRDARYRGFKTFRLQGYDVATNSFQTLFEMTDIPLRYGDAVAQQNMFIDDSRGQNFLTFRANIPTFSGDRFRAEFVQYSSIARGHASGARIWELDGFDTSFASSAVPEPSAFLALTPLGVSLILRRHRGR
ncbi:MAG: hypothetical protein AAFU85_28460 [Planctomycetota bacterium]